MAGGLNKEFMSDPVAFLDKYMFSVKDQDLATGVVELGFINVSGGGNRLQLGKFAGGLAGNKIKAYFLKAVPDQVNPGTIDSTTDATYFFTSTIQGCQFLANGASRTNLSVEHNNYFSNPANYATHFGGITAGTVTARVHNGGLYNLANGDMGNVVGKKDATGWTLWFQKEDGGTRTISTQAIVS
jgi:hypothetical protein